MNATYSAGKEAICGASFKIAPLYFETACFFNQIKSLKHWIHEKMVRKVFSLFLPCCVLCHRAIAPLCHIFRHMLCAFFSAAPFTNNPRQQPTTENCTGDP